MWEMTELRDFIVSRSRLPELRSKAESLSSCEWSTGTRGVVVEYRHQATEYSAGIVSLHVHGTVPAAHTQQDQVSENIWPQSQKYLIYGGNI